MKPNRKELVRLQRVLDDNEHDLALVAKHLSRVHERLTIASTTLSLMQLHADTTIEPPPESIGPVERFHIRQEQIKKGVAVDVRYPWD